MTDKKRPHKTDWLEHTFQGGTLILRVVQEAADLAPIPYLKQAAGLSLQIIDTVQAVKDNREAFDQLAKDAAALVAAIWRSYQVSSHKGLDWPPAGLKDVVIDLVQTLKSIQDLAEEKLSRRRLVRVLYNKADPGVLKAYRDKLAGSISNFEIVSHLTINEVLAEGARNAIDMIHSKAMKFLRDNIASGAIYDSAERFDAPKCHPQTRHAIIEKIMDWIEDPVNHRVFLWIYGPVGCGKSAIAQTIAERCDKAGILAASFFFSRTAAGRNDNTHFIASLTYQLCLAVPELRDQVARTMNRDPSIFTRSISRQMEELVTKPLKEVVDNRNKTKGDKSRPRLIIVDGLDECSDGRSQRDILTALSTSVSQFKTFPFVFVVASRPEHDIRRAFNDNILNLLMTGMPLDDAYEPSDDIRIFLQSKFDEIKQNHPLGAYLPVNWPSPADLDYLVMKASGQFIYASTVIKYIESRHHQPTHRLSVVLGLYAGDNDQDLPFAQLDALYAHVLSSIHESNLSRALEILSWVILDKRVNEKTLEFIDNLLSYQAGDAQIILNDLSALLNIPDTQSEDHNIRVLHASFPDFLLDQSRSGKFFIDSRKAHTNLTRNWIRYYNAECDHSDLAVESIIGHCINAELTLELQNDLVTFSFAPIFSDNSSPDSFWRKFYAIINFVRWLENQTISDPQKTVYRYHLEDLEKMIRERISQYPPGFSTFLCIALTFPHIMLHRSRHVSPNAACFTHLIFPKDPAGEVDIREFDDTSLGIATVFISPDSDTGAYEWTTDYDTRLYYGTKSLLCRLLSELRLPMDGDYFVDATRYTDFARILATAILPMHRPDSNNKTVILQLDNEYNVARFLAVVLTKAAPDPALAIFLRDNAVQFRRSLLLSRASDDDNEYPWLHDSVHELALSSLIYVKESGIPFKEHSHTSEKNVCYICISEQWEVELSEDPKPAVEVVVVAPDLIVRRNWIPGAFLLAWFAQLILLLRRLIFPMYA